MVLHAQSLYRTTDIECEQQSEICHIGCRRQLLSKTRSIWKMLGPFATVSLFTVPFTRCRYCHTPPLSHSACASMSTTTTTMTTRDRGDHYGPIEWAQQTGAYHCLYRHCQQLECSGQIFWVQRRDVSLFLKIPQFTYLPSMGRGKPVCKKISSIRAAVLIP